MQRLIDTHFMLYCYKKRTAACLSISVLRHSFQHGQYSTHYTTHKHIYGYYSRLIFSNLYNIAHFHVSGVILCYAEIIQILGNKRHIQNMSPFRGRLLFGMIEVEIGNCHTTCSENVNNIFLYPYP